MKNTFKVEIGGYIFDSKLGVKYLGAIIDAERIFKEHLEYTY